MIDAGPDFQRRVSAPERRIYGRIIIDYTNPQENQEIDVVVNEISNLPLKNQVIDSITDSSYKWASLDGSCVLNGEHHPAPGTELTFKHYQVGWWGKKFSGSNGSFTEPFPTITLNFVKPRSIKELNVVGDICRGEFPKDFTIFIKNENGNVLYSENVTNNAEVNWEKQIPIVSEATQLTLVIKKWNLPGRQAKIIELFSIIREMYEGSDVLRISLLEERDISHGSLPIGNISSNEIEIMLNNIDHHFSPGNRRSPIYGYMKSNRRIQAWIGMYAYVEYESEGENENGN